MRAAQHLVVAHRPQRGLQGAFHEDTLFGAVPGYEGVFTRRIPAALLTAKMLAEPREVKVGGKTTLNMRSKGGVVRDPALRHHIRTCLTQNGLNPDDFSPKQLQELIKGGRLTMPSGVPIRRVRLLKKIEDPVAIETDPAHPRFYIGGNNHHFEIVEDEGTGRWHGRGVKMYDVARRIHPPKGRPRLPAVLGPKAAELRETGSLERQDEEFYRGRAFVMALCKGDMLTMKDPEDDAEGLFVVVKVNPDSVQMVEHCDARPASETDRQPARRLIEKAANQLRVLVLSQS
jgi:hypothetical protein